MDGAGRSLRSIFSLFSKKRMVKKGINTKWEYHEMGKRGDGR